ncbi:MAG: phospholipase D family protein [Candidatus Dadabacteria bacterium]|nr:phospholipase D family protein [Candidatus Dadabacteria bacterium]
MAEVDILFQGLNRNDNHELAVNNLLTKPDIDNYLFSIAFVRRNGVERIQDNLRVVAKRAKFFIGIRNGITSVQSMFSLLKLGISPYAVDTASSKKIFHPKIYMAYNKTRAYVLMGSSNLTFGGLNQNIEASSYIILHRNQHRDENYFQKIVTSITNMPQHYPDHVFKITSKRQAVSLLREGRIEDERLVRLPTVNQIQKGENKDDVKPIPTYSISNIDTKKAIKMYRGPTPTNVGVLVWESKPLTQRSLNIPKGSTTNITGDTNLGQGLMRNIDFQTYFRRIVFSQLNWSTNPTSTSPYLERAIIDAEIVINNLSYGKYKLEITHDPRTNTASYRQKNSMTKIKWGKAKPLIAKESLLRCTLRLFQRSTTEFVIAID